MATTEWNVTNHPSAFDQSFVVEFDGSKIQVDSTSPFSRPK